jgi:hypothetical protein
MRIMERDASSFALLSNLVDTGIISTPKRRRVFFYSDFQKF